ncbi:unnamed protein product [Ostreobium quekettii]|uniref:Calcineurin-like phosphoesterase domain-containing protein n=1 Tax=Ostreobium quekettii TaxID=121088 RepID=A0A8S1IN52_9CHLO|nr:unnamed protein product [Ostreobium quekettii]
MERAEPFLELLEQFEPRELYIVGDFIDGWKLKRRWRWLPVYDQILQRLMDLRRRGAKIYYTPGNHDDFLRGFLANFGVVEIKDQFVHTAADGRRFLVMHGDQFDSIEQNAQWLSWTASFAYDVLLSTNWLVNRIRGKKVDPYAFCGMVKRRVKRLVRHVSEFEGQLVESARDSDCNGIICGHIHSPRIVDVDGLAYCNTGDWVENCSALVEYEDGGFQLLRRDGSVIDELPATGAARSNPQATRPATAAGCEEEENLPASAAPLHGLLAGK